jgi:hypothetical protein
MVETLSSLPNGHHVGRRAGSVWPAIRWFAGFLRHNCLVMLRLMPRFLWISVWKSYVTAQLIVRVGVARGLRPARRNACNMLNISCLRDEKAVMPQKCWFFLADFPEQRFAQLYSKSWVLGLPITRRCMSSQTRHFGPKS